MTLGWEISSQTIIKSATSFVSIMYVMFALLIKSMWGGKLNEL